MNENNYSKTALKAGAWYVVSSIIVKTISIISIPIFTRLLSLDEFGTISTFVSWFSILSTFFSLNLNYSIGRAKLDFPKQLRKYILSMQITIVIINGPVLLLSLIFLKSISKILGLSNFLTALLVAYLFFSPVILFVQNGFRYEYEYKKNILIALYSAFSTVFLSILFIKFLPISRVNSRALGIVIPNCLLSIYLWFLSIRREGFCLNMQYCKYGILISVPLILHTVSMYILSQSDRIFIAKICGASESGIYSLGYSYGIIINVILGALSDGWLPWFHDNYYAGNYQLINQNSKKIILLGFFLGLAAIAFAPEAVIILGGKGYIQSLYSIPPIIIGIVCQYIYTHYVNIELHLKKTKYVSLGTSFAAGINIILNIIFIPHFGFIAAAYTTFVSYFLLMLLHYVITRYIMKVNIYNTCFMFGIFLMTCILAFLLMFLYSYFILRYCIILIGFGFFLYVFRNDVNFFVKKISTKK